MLDGRRKLGTDGRIKLEDGELDVGEKQKKQKRKQQKMKKKRRQRSRSAAREGWCDGNRINLGEAGLLGAAWAVSW